MSKNAIVILEDSAFFKKGQLIESYNVDEDGVLVEDKYIPENSYVVLKEQLSLADEKRIKELVRQQLKALFWNLYTKQSIIIGNI